MKNPLVLLLMTLGGAFMVLAAVLVFKPQPQVQVTVSLTEYGISAMPYWARKGDMVEMTITNHGQLMHELEIEGYDLEVEDLGPGQTRTLRFKATRSGAFELVCHLPGHYEAGMYTHFTVME